MCECWNNPETGMFEACAEHEPIFIDYMQTVEKLREENAELRGSINEWRLDFAGVRKRINEAGLIDYLKRQWLWSKQTFGPGKRTRGIIQHIGKELLEIEAKPEDLSEWVDVMILAMDGYWRHGGTPGQLMHDLQAKQNKNFARIWPTPKSEDDAIEHER